MTPEGKVKIEIKAALQELKAYYFMPSASQYGSAGTPDFIGCLDGIFFGIEAKAGGNEPTALQNRAMRKIRDAGGVALVINEENVSSLRTMLKVYVAEAKQRRRE